MVGVVCACAGCWQLAVQLGVSAGQEVASHDVPTQELDWDWTCAPIDPARVIPMTCEFTTESGRGVLCGDVTVSCGVTQHHHSLCTKPLQANVPSRHHIGSVTPPVTDLSRCTAIRFTPTETR